MACGGDACKQAVPGRAHRCELTLAGDEDERCRRTCVGTRGVHGIGALGSAWVRRSGIGDWASESFRNIAKTALRRLPVMKRDLRRSPSHPLRLIQNHKAGNFTLADPHVCAGALSITRLDAPDSVRSVRPSIAVACGPCSAEAGSTDGAPAPTVTLYRGMEEAPRAGASMPHMARGCCHCQSTTSTTCHQGQARVNGFGRERATSVSHTQAH